LNEGESARHKEKTMQNQDLNRCPEPASREPKPYSADFETEGPPEIKDSSAVLDP